MLSRRNLGPCCAVWMAVIMTLECQAFAPRFAATRTFRLTTNMGTPMFYNDFEGYNEENEKSSSSNNDDDDDDDDDLVTIDPDSLGDWRAFRRSLATSILDEDASVAAAASTPTTPVSYENERLLETQSAELAREYRSGVWAHEVSTPEVGGLVVRLPLEVEIYRNYKHSLTGRRLRRLVPSTLTSPAVWYKRAQQLVEDDMLEIAEQAGEDGQIDPSTLGDEYAELLQLYLDNQETWQEVCLVLEHVEGKGATTVVLNRPMALKLTDNLARLVLYGAFRGGKTDRARTTSRRVDADLFLTAFGQECAVYVGGPDDQDKPAELIHGIADLEGAVEISPGSGIYRGGIEAAIEGVLVGQYKPMDFRFFVGRHSYDDSGLDLSVVLGKYQPVACARSVVLKQCISLPKPLWHEALELCGGEMKEYSKLELMKRGDLQFQVIDDDDDDDDELNELDELETFDDDDDEYYTN